MWLEPNQIREKFSIAANRFETQIVAASESASLIIQRSVDSDVYDEAAGSTAPTNADDLTRYKGVVQAHSYLTMWFLVGSVGNKLRDDGFIKAAQDGSSGVQTAMVTHQYLTPKELEVMRAQYLRDAQMWIGPYGSIDLTIDVVEPEQSLAMSSLQWF